MNFRTTKKLGTVHIQLWVIGRCIGENLDRISDQAGPKLRQVCAAFGTDTPGLHVNGDGVVNSLDLVFVADRFRIED
jgi:hypothetical protein